MDLKFLNKKKYYLNEIAKGIEHKNQETLNENKTIEYTFSRSEFCHTCAGILSIM